MRSISGYYRVNYDNENWLLLARALANSHTSFGESTRIQLLNDVLALQKTGRLRLRIAFEMTKFLQKETDPVVWMSAVGLLDHLFLKYSEVGVDPDHSKKVNSSIYTLSLNSSLLLFHLLLLNILRPFCRYFMIFGLSCKLLRVKCSIWRIAKKICFII